MIFVLLLAILSVFSHKKSEKHKNKINSILNEIIDKALLQISSKEKLDKE
jgi:hypothetical protein